MRYYVLDLCSNELYFAVCSYLFVLFLQWLLYSLQQIDEIYFSGHEM